MGKQMMKLEAAFLEGETNLKVLLFKLLLDELALLFSERNTNMSDYVTDR
jgi:hypothetical protein